MTTHYRPPLRVLTFGEDGLIKVIQDGTTGMPEVVQTWDNSTASNYVNAVSLNNQNTPASNYVDAVSVNNQNTPLLGVARRVGAIEFRDPCREHIWFTIPNVTNSSDPFAGLHLFNKQDSQDSIFLCCTKNGKASMRSLELAQFSHDILYEWKLNGDILFCKVDRSEEYCMFGGNNNGLKIWDLKANAEYGAAVHPRHVWYTCGTFLTKGDPNVFVVGTNTHELHIYDARDASQGPCFTSDITNTCGKMFNLHMKKPIQALAEDQDGCMIYFGNGCGDLAAFDLRRGKVLDVFRGLNKIMYERSCEIEVTASDGSQNTLGAIRSLAKHHESTLLASGGVDSYVNIWDVKKRSQTFGVFLGNHLTNVILDPTFASEVTNGDDTTPISALMSCNCCGITHWPRDCPNRDQHALD